MQSRLNLYREVHKGIRAMLFDLVAHAGRTEWSDANDVAALRTGTQKTFTLLTAHAQYEEAFLQPLLERYAPKVADRVGNDHLGQEFELAQLAVMLNGIDATSPDAATRGHAFMVHLSRVTGELLVHMADEEELAMPALASALSDAALLEVKTRLMESIPPAEAAQWGEIILPALSPSERNAILAARAA